MFIFPKWLFAFLNNDIAKEDLDEEYKEYCSRQRLCYREELFYKTKRKDIIKVVKAYNKAVRQINKAQKDQEKIYKKSNTLRSVSKKLLIRGRVIGLETLIEVLQTFLKKLEDTDFEDFLEQTKDTDNVSNNDWDVDKM